MINIIMKNIITKILLVWSAVASIIGVSKKREPAALNDAIRLPETGRTAVMEDYEMLAYHNQA